MGFATVEEQQSQLQAVVREKAETERALKLATEEFEAAKVLEDHEVIVFQGRRMRELQRNLTACNEQLKLIEGAGTTRQERARRR